MPFDVAAQIDLDAALVEPDNRRDYGKSRYVAYGKIAERLHVLCFKLVPDGIRVISFRKANAREIKYYEKETADR